MGNEKSWQENTLYTPLITPSMEMQEYTIERAFARKYLSYTYIKSYNWVSTQHERFLSSLNKKPKVQRIWYEIRETFEMTRNACMNINNSVEPYKKFRNLFGKIINFKSLKDQRVQMLISLNTLRP